MPPEGTRDLLQRLITQIQNGTFPYDEKTPDPIDWASYDAAQINEINDILNEIRRTVNRVWQRTQPTEENEDNGPGRPPTHPPDVAKALLVQQYFETSNRQTQGLIQLFKEKLDIQDTFSYKTIERGYDNDDVMRIVDAVRDDAANSVAPHETGFATDGTGLPTSQKINYETSKRKGRKRDWEHLIATFGTQTGMILEMTLLEDANDAEAPAFKHALPSKDRFPNLETGTADAAFLSRENVERLHEQGITPRIFPKKNVGFKSKGHAGWHTMLRALLNDPQTWLRDYHQRSKAETGFSVLQTRHPRAIRRRLKTRKHAAGRVRGSVHNLRRKVYLSYLTNWLAPPALGS